MKVLCRSKFIFLGFLLFLFATPSALSQYKLNDFDLDNDLTIWYDSLIGLDNRGELRGSFKKFAVQ